MPAVKKKKRNRPASPRTAKNRSQADTLTAFRKLIEPKSTPDKVIHRGKVRGKKSNLPLGQFIFNLFVLNEQLPSSRKMTNEELKRQIFKDFPHHRHVLEPLFEKNIYSVNTWRAQYNRKQLIQEEPPCCSFRYNLDGQKVDSRTGKKIFNDADILSYLDYYGYTAEGTPPTKEYRQSPHGPKNKGKKRGR